MKTFQYNPDAHICNCTNQALLSHGDICDLCMGMVEGKEGNSSKASSQYDEQYFEALESHYQDFTFAA